MPTLSNSALLGLLIFLVVISLGTNVLLILYGLYIRKQVLDPRTTVRSMLSEAVNDLRRIEDLTLHFRVKVQDEIPFAAEVPVREEMEVDVKGRVPVNQTFTTDVRVNAGPLGIRVPVNVSVPLDIEVPIDLRVPVLVESTIPVSVAVPIDLVVPVQVDLGQTELGEVIEEIREQLAELAGVIGGIAFDETPPAQ